jgi:endonuclease YncB( thermonuclease family)
MSNRKLAVALSLTLALMALSVSAMAARRAQLQHVVDGDTVRLRSDKYVRFIGVNAPESSQCGGRASERVMNRL